MDYKEIFQDSFFKDTYSKIEELKKDFPVNHGFIHVDHVIENAKKLALVFELNEKEKQLLLIASALHDIGYLCGRDDHAKNGAPIARDYLKDKLPSEDIEIICKAIANHGGKTEEDFSNKVSTCLIMADKLDFVNTRYKFDKDDTKHGIFNAIENVELIRSESPSSLILRITSSNKEIFNSIPDNYFFNKLKNTLELLYKTTGYNTKIEIV